MPNSRISKKVVDKRRLFASGLWYRTDGVFSTADASNLAMSMNLCYFEPFTILRTTAFDTFGLNVVTGGSANTIIRFGIYSDDGYGKPQKLFLDAGTITAVTPGDDGIIKTLSSSFVLTPNLWWLVAVAQVGSSPTVTAIQAAYGVSGLIGSSSAGTGQFYNEYSQGSVTGALPATATPVAALGASPKMMVRAL